MKFAKKTLAALPFCFSLVAPVALASEIQIDAREIQGLPRIQVVGVDTDSGPEVAAVQPTAELKFRHASCSAFIFRAETQTSLEGVLLVQMKIPPGQRECHGPRTMHDYSVQISSDFNPATRVVVLNPAIGLGPNR